jgi:hypothetical protein
MGDTEMKETRELLTDAEEREVNRLYTNIRLGTILRRISDAYVALLQELDASKDLAKTDFEETLKP